MKLPDVLDRIAVPQTSTLPMLVASCGLKILCLLCTATYCNPRWTPFGQWSLGTDLLVSQNEHAQQHGVTTGTVLTKLFTKVHGDLHPGNTQ